MATFPKTESDLLLLNGKVRAMNSHPGVDGDAVLIRGNRIRAVGSKEMLSAMAGNGCRSIDLGGALVLPGFNDAHVHFMAGGFSMAQIDLRNADTPLQLAAALGDWAARLPAGQWILGGEWDHEKWPGANLPTRQTIDPLTAKWPVFINRFDGHMGLANSLALRLAGIGKETLDPPGGVIVRDPRTGEPTGILKDAAQDLITRVLPPRDKVQKADAAAAATRHAASLGVTSVTDVSGDEDVPLYEAMAARGELLTRIYAARPIPTWQTLAEFPGITRNSAKMVRIGAVKGFCDGSLGSSTALFFDPYADDPENRGLLFDQMFPEGIMLERAMQADKLGLQVLIHAIGDAANREILSIFSTIAREHGPRDRRFRIEHAQHLHPDDVSIFGREGIVASMQPYHAADDGCWCEKRLGADRCRLAYPFRSLLECGAVLAFGSDWTVAPLNPLLGIQAAVTRQTLDGRHPDGWIPEQKLSVFEAVHAYTVGSAFAEFSDGCKGTIAPGMLADLVVLDRDIFEIPPGQIEAAKVLMTIVDGRIVFQA